MAGAWQLTPPGWSNLWVSLPADRWAWFIRKKFGIKSEKPNDTEATAAGALANSIAVSDRF